MKDRTHESNKSVRSNNIASGKLNRTPIKAKT
jgi:hypothetical protein